MKCHNQDKDREHKEMVMLRSTNTKVYYRWLHRLRYTGIMVYKKPRFVCLLA